MIVSPKKLFTGAGVVLVVGFLTWLTTPSGREWVFKLFHRVTIKTVSIPRGAEDNFYPGERIRFSLVGVQVQRVLWIFDEAASVPGYIDIDYSFRADAGKPRGGSRYHSVVALYLYGDAYHAASRLCLTQNLKVATTIRICPDSAVVTAPTRIDGDWTLDHVTLNSYRAGVFRSSASVPVIGTKTAVTATTVIPTHLIQEALGPDASDNLTAALGNEGKVWMSYEFRSATNPRKLSLLEPVKGQQVRAQ